MSTSHPATMDRDAPLAFVHIAKTGGSTIKYILRNSLGIDHANIMSLDPGGAPCTDEDIRFASKVFFGLRSISSHGLQSPTLRLQTPLRFFTWLRDPIKRSASHYQQIFRHRGYEGRTFSLEEYLGNEKNHNRQVCKIAGAPDLELAKRELAERYVFIGLLERFEESMAMFAQHCDFPLDLRYPRMHVARTSDEKKRVLSDPACLQLLEEANALDAQLYAYVRDVIYPKQLEQTPPGDVLPKIDEKANNSLSWRFRWNKMYQMGIYRTLVKRERKKRQRQGGRGEATLGA